MKNIVVLIPDGFFVEYFVYSKKEYGVTSRGKGFGIEKKGKIKFRGLEASANDIRNLITDYKPEAVAVRVLYGGNEFKAPTICDESVMEKLKSLIPQSPLHIPLAIKLITLLEKTIPALETILFFETALFADLPIQEQVYALSDEFADMTVRRFGYHGLFHQAAVEEVKRQHGDARRIISICLEPVPEVAAVCNGKAIMVSSGSTPLDGIPGDTTCGEIDPGIILLLEKKKKWGPEMINEVLTRKSGLSAVVGKKTSIDEVFHGDERYEAALKFFEYRILLACGSAMALMNGFDAVIFSGRYIHAAEKLSEWLLPKLAAVSAGKFESGAPLSNTTAYFLHDSLGDVIAEDCESLKL